MWFFKKKSEVDKTKKSDAILEQGIVEAEDRLIELNNKRNESFSLLGSGENNEVRKVSDDALDKKASLLKQSDNTQCFMLDVNNEMRDMEDALSDNMYMSNPENVKRHDKAGALSNAKAAASEEGEEIHNDPLINYLLDNFIIDAKQLDTAYYFYRKNKDKLIGDILIELGYVADSVIKEALHSVYGIENFDIKRSVIDKSLLKKVPKEFALSNGILPIMYNGDHLYIAIHDIYDVVLLDRIKSFFPGVKTIIPIFVRKTDILSLIDKHYGYESKIAETWKKVAESNNDSGAYSEEVGNTLSDLVDSIISDAVRMGSSDIHFEPTAMFLRVRYRVDGVLFQQFNIDIALWDSMMVRIKIMSNMNIAERRHPQDGRLSLEVLGRKIDFRISVQPTSYGENCVVRILDSVMSVLDIMKIGCGKHNEDLIISSLSRSDGIVIVVGPTGSGKSTTLYSMLSYMNTPEVNIMTAEDPIEYTLPMIRQSSVSDKKGFMSFDECIRSLMRQDPDIIFIGEVRDLATASLATKAAMTGHKVLTSLHANDAVAALPRLLDIGVDPANLSSAITCVVAQRLCRVLCNNCKRAYKASNKEKYLLQVDRAIDLTLYKRVGCNICKFSGCLGRHLICEVMVVDQNIRKLIAKNAPYYKYAAYLKNTDTFINMKAFGIQKVISGDIDIEELIARVDMVEDLINFTEKEDRHAGMIKNRKKTRN